MGFFKNIFKKKKGGTFVGNLIRGVASTATGGVLGSGAGLANWEAEQEAKELNALKAQIASQQKQINAKQFGADLVNSAIKNGTGGQTDPNVGESIVLTTLKKWWWAVLLLFVAFGTAVYFIARPKGSKSNFKFRR